jgi:Cys-tRNA(Pro) deacylase
MCNSRKETAMLSTDHLMHFLDEHNIEAEILELSVPTPTVEDAAEAVGARPEQVVKSLLFLVDDQPVVAIACGTSRVDRRPIAAHFGVGRKRVKLGDAATVLAVTGYPIGAMPPFGQKSRLLTLVDHRVLDHEHVFAGGGSINALMRIDPAEIVRVTDAVELDLINP